MRTLAVVYAASVAFLLYRTIRVWRKPRSVFEWAAVVSFILGAPIALAGAAAVHAWRWWKAPLVVKEGRTFVRYID